MSSNVVTLVGNGGRSLQIPHQQSVQPSGRDVAEPCLTNDERQCFETLETVTTLMAILQGIVENTTSGDVIYLGMARARDLCDAMGIDKATVDDVFVRFKAFSTAARRGNPFAF